MLRGRNHGSGRGPRGVWLQEGQAGCPLGLVTACAGRAAGGAARRGLSWGRRVPACVLQRAERRERGVLRLSLCSPFPNTSNGMRGQSKT